jgi:glycosyltransferase involved in cell wall biosynthesis
MSVSIVIPIGHKDQNFEIIDQIKEKFKEYEVILVSSYQNTEAKTLEEKVDQFLSIHNSSRAKAMNAGAEIAQNEMLWFLHLDSDLSLISSIDLERVNDE